MLNVLHDRDWIAARIPHRGSMCLLDAVVEQSPTHIRCRARSHRDAMNPLRSDGRLGVACGIEYAAQAMAVHGGGSCDNVTDAPQPRQGYLISVRSVSFFTDRLDDVAGDLDIGALRLSGDDNVVLYEFRVRNGDALLLQGRAAVMLDADMGHGNP